MSKATGIKFKDAFAKLNAVQKEAVETLDGPVMVLAGPGTGKTQIIAMRIANILQTTDTPPNAILALTFTDSGVQAMRKRLVELIGTDGYYVQIYTFHSFCADIIRAHPEDFLISPDPQPLSDLERFQIVQDILDTHPFEILKPVNAPYYYVRAIISSIQTLKREGFEPPAFRLLVEKEVAQYEELLELSKDKKNKVTKTTLETARKLAEKNQALLEIFYLYQKAVVDKGRFDFEDMINFVIQKFTTQQELLLRYQEASQYILVDEFQDTNSAQNKVVALLASYWGDQANVFVVGDPNQSIYRFQGANLENLLAFTSLYPKAKILVLEDNYRSTQEVLDAAASVIKNNKDQEQSIVKNMTFPLKSHSDIKDRKIQLAQLPSDLVEDFFIAESIKNLLDAGIAAHEIAVIYRKNVDAIALSQMLARFQIPVQIQGGNNILNDPHVRQLLNLLRVIRSVKIAEEGTDLFNVLSLPFFHLDPLDTLKITRAASKKKVAIVDIIQSDKYLEESEVDQPESFKDFLNKISNWEREFSQLTLAEAIETVVMQSGLLKYLEERPDGIEKLNRLRAILNLASDWYRTNPDMDLNDFLANIELMESNGIDVDEPDLGIGEGAVTLTTAHKAKGLEWNYVFLYRCIDGVWGNVTTRDLIKLPSGILQYQKVDMDKKEEQNEDERRLFYVALTRARQQVTISYANQYASTSKAAIPSMFVGEIQDHLWENIDTTSTTQGIRDILADLFKPVSSEIGSKENIFLKKLIDSDFHLSPTAYTTFIECPYKFKLQNLIRIPQPPNPSLIFGSTVHKTLEMFYRVYQQEDMIWDLETLLERFRYFLKSQPLPTKELALRLKQGEQILTSYYNYHEGKFLKPLATEKWFGGQFNPIFFEDISLVGKIDRIEFIDTDRKTVRIVDYKTGKPKTLGQINGETQDSNGSYKKQLIFYKLVTELDSKFDYKVAEVVLDFVEGPALEKRFVRHTLVITDEELSQTKVGIREVVAQIRNLSFDRTSDMKLCTNCPFKDHCWAEGVPTIKPEQLALL